MKSFGATLNGLDFSFKMCRATINVRDFFPINSRNLHRDLRNFFCARHFPRLRYLQKIIKFIKNQALLTKKIKTLNRSVTVLS